MSITTGSSAARNMSAHPSPFTGREWDAIEAALQGLEHRTNAVLAAHAAGAAPDSTLLDEALEVYSRLRAFVLQWNVAARADPTEVYWENSRAAQGHFRRWAESADRLSQAMQQARAWGSYGRSEQFLKAVARARLDVKTDLEELRQSEERVAAAERASRSALVARGGGGC